MARTNNLTNFLTDVAGAIKTKKGSQTSIPAASFDTEILALPSQGTYEDKSVNITQNGNTIVTPSGNYDALSRVTITTAVPEKQLQTKSYNFTQNATLELTPDTGYDGFSKVNLTINTPTQDLSDATATPNSILRGYTAYNGTGKVTGTFYGAKLFDTLADLQANPPVADDSYGLIYGSTLAAITETTEFDSCTFPANVTLPDTISTTYYPRFRAVDGWFDGNVTLNATQFRFSGWGDEMIEVTYTSNDGIHYTRTDGGDETISFGTTIKCEMEWTDYVGYFMKILSGEYGGLYEKEEYTDDSTYYNVLKIKSIGTDNIVTEPVSVINKTTINDLISTALSSYSMTANGYILKKVSNTRYIGYCTKYYSSSSVGGTAIYTDGNLYLSAAPFTDNTGNYYLDVDLTNNTCTVNTNPSIKANMTIQSTNYAIYNTQLNVDDEIIVNGSNYLYVWYYDSTNNHWTYHYNTKELLPLYRWKVAPTQFDATADYVYNGKVFLGSAGAGTGTMASNPSLTNTDAHIYGLLRNSYSNMQKVVITDSNKSTIKTQMRYWKLIPSLTDGSSLLDMSGLTDGSGLFQYDNQMDMEYIEALDTSTLTNISGMFNNSRIYHLPQLNLTNVTTMTSAFASMSCTELSITPPSNAITNMQSVFNSTKLSTFPTINTTGCTNWNYTFWGCSNMTTIPNYDYSSGTSFDRTFRDTPIVTVPNNTLPTTGITTLYCCFLNCTNLVNVPVIGTNGIRYSEGFNSTFSNCPNLSNESLNNIMQMCINATSYGSTKTLKHLGLSSAQATTCQSLSNYSAFIAAGWTTGY